MFLYSPEERDTERVRENASLIHGSASELRVFSFHVTRSSEESERRVRSETEWARRDETVEKSEVQANMNNEGNKEEEEKKLE